MIVGLWVGTIIAPLLPQCPAILGFRFFTHAGISRQRPLHSGGAVCVLSLQTVTGCHGRSDRRQCVSVRDFEGERDETR